MVAFVFCLKACLTKFNKEFGAVFFYSIISPEQSSLLQSIEVLFSIVCIAYFTSSQYGQ